MTGHTLTPGQLQHLRDVWGPWYGRTIIGNFGQRSTDMIENTPDFGEPWYTSDYHVEFPYDRNKTSCTRPQHILRSIACVNALAGIDDPAAFVARAKRIEESARRLATAMQNGGVLASHHEANELRAALAEKGGQ